MPRRCGQGRFEWAEWLLPTERQEVTDIGTLERTICDQLAALQKRRQTLFYKARSRRRSAELVKQTGNRGVMDAAHRLAAE